MRPRPTNPVPCQLPAMANAVGKKVFKRHLDVFLKPMFDTISRITTSQLARHAAVSCVRQLSAFVGPSIFRGRLTDSQREVRERWCIPLLSACQKKKSKRKAKVHPTVAGSSFIHVEYEHGFL